MPAYLPPYTPPKPPVKVDPYKPKGAALDVDAARQAYINTQNYTPFGSNDAAGYEKWGGDTAFLNWWSENKGKENPTSYAGDEAFLYALANSGNATAQDVLNWKPGDTPAITSGTGGSTGGSTGTVTPPVDLPPELNLPPVSNAPITANLPFMPNTGQTAQIPSVGTGTGADSPVTLSDAAKNAPYVDGPQKGNFGPPKADAPITILGETVAGAPTPVEVLKMPEAIKAPPPVTDRMSEIVMAGRDAKKKAQAKKGYMSTLLAGETGGFTGSGKTLLGGAAQMGGSTLLS